MKVPWWNGGVGWKSLDLLGGKEQMDKDQVETSYKYFVVWVHDLHSIELVYFISDALIL